jgi:hypothetical protein
VAVIKLTATMAAQAERAAAVMVAELQLHNLLAQLTLEAVEAVVQTIQPLMLEPAGRVWLLFLPLKRRLLLRVHPQLQQVAVTLFTRLHLLAQ